jgi:hypothetical protein
VPLLGAALAAGSLGLLAGLAVPLLGFLGALGAHLRVGSRQLVGGVVFLALAVASLVLNLGYHTP